jgi:hypothetical protein
LAFLVEIKKVPITLPELEYFAEMEDPGTLSMARKYANDPEGFQKLEAGYDSYEQLVKTICRYNYQADDLNVKVQTIARALAKGFLAGNNIKNLALMNYATLDFYLSGENKINRDMLLSNIRIWTDRQEIEAKLGWCEDKLRSWIGDLPENKLSIVIKNWSGTTIIKKNQQYSIKIGHGGTDSQGNPSEIFFATCSWSMTIHWKYFESDETFNLLTSLLTVPMNTMVDN